MRAIRPPRRRLRAAWQRSRAGLVAALFLAPLAFPSLVASGEPGGEAPLDLDLNFGVFSSLAETQARKAVKTDSAPIAAVTSGTLARARPIDAPRVEPIAPYTIVETTQGIPEASPIFDLLATTPLRNYTSVVEFLLSGPLSYAVYTNCSGTEHWDNGSLRPTLQLEFTGTALQLVDWERWVEIDCDQNGATGDALGLDLRVRLTPIIENISYGINPSFGNGLPSLNPSITFLGGLSIEVERLGPTSLPLPLDIAVFKSFSYDQNNYVWFMKFDFPAAPPAFNASFTSNEVNIQGNLSSTIETILGGLAGNLSDANYISDMRGPYRIGWHLVGTVGALGISGGYARYLSTGGTPALRERTWFDVALRPGSGQAAVPSNVLFRLDSESFNTSFDYLEWNADRPARVDLQYHDERENYTYARATLDDMPPYLQARVDQVGSGPNATARVEFRASDAIRVIDYDEYIFLNGQERDFIYSHVRLEDLPLAILINGTLDIGGVVIEPQLRRTGGASLVGEVIDRVMIRIASKLYSIGQTLRAIPNNILNLPHERGWVSIDLPLEGEIGLLEFWLTSGSYAVAGGNYVAFYNDTTPNVPPGAVGTSLSGRLQHISHLVGGFIEETTLTLVTRGGLPLEVLFLDDPEDARAVAEIVNLPAEFTLKIAPQSLRYAANGGISSIAYTSTIGSQYTRILLRDLPPYIALNQTPGDTRIDTVGGPIRYFEMLASDGVPKTLANNLDHLLSYQNATLNAVSARIHDISGLRYIQGAGGKVSFTADGGEPFAMVFINETAPLEAILNFEPLPSQLDVTLPGSLESVNPIRLPSLGSLASVVDFSNIIFGINEFGRSVVEMLSQVGTNLANGIGRFDQNFSFSFNSTANTTLTASVSKGVWTSANEAKWIHGLRSNQRVSPMNLSALDLNAKLYLTGLPRNMSFALNVEAEVLSVNATLKDFTPAFDYLAVETNAASPDPNDQPKDVRFFVDGILPRTDLALKVDFRSDLSIGGAVVGNMSVVASQPLKDFYVRLTTQRPRPTTVEVLIPTIPTEMHTRAEMAEGISISHAASDRVPFVLVKMGRGIVGPDASAYAIFHDVPTLANIRVPAGDTFDMSASNPLKGLPDVTMEASQKGLDLVADLNGQALGSRGSLRFIALNLGLRLTMIRSGPSYAISSDGVDRLLFEFNGFPLSKGLTIDAASIYAENVHSVSVSHQLVFNSFPILSVENLHAGKMQLRFEHRVNALSGTSKPTTFLFVTVPLGAGGPVSVTANGLVTSPESSGRYLILPAPILSWLMSQF